MSYDSLTKVIKNCKNFARFNYSEEENTSIVQAYESKIAHNLADTDSNKAVVIGEFICVINSMLGS